MGKWLVIFGAFVGVTSALFGFIPGILVGVFSTALGFVLHQVESLKKNLSHDAGKILREIEEIRESLASGAKK